MGFAVQSICFLSLEGNGEKGSLIYTIKDPWTIRCRLVDLILLNGENAMRAK
jgi:hypothetical protein